MAATRPLLLAIALVAPAPAAAAAGELFGGVLAHGVDTPLTDDIGERGVAIEAGWRSAPVAALRAIGAPRVHVLGSVVAGHGTDFAAAGLDWRIAVAGPFYVRPGIGVAVHDGPSRRVGGDGYRTDLGSRVLFEPELSAGVALTPRLSVEASWVHLSHAQIFGPQNPGLDMIGVRANLTLDRTRVP